MGCKSRLEILKGAQSREFGGKQNAGSFPEVLWTTVYARRNFVSIL